MFEGTIPPYLQWKATDRLLTHTTHDRSCHWTGASQKPQEYNPGVPNGVEKDEKLRYRWGKCDDWKTQWNGSNHQERCARSHQHPL